MVIIAGLLSKTVLCSRPTFAQASVIHVVLYFILGSSYLARQIFGVML
jgi:hypothetical protein